MTTLRIMTPRLTNLLRDYDAWADQRADISTREANGDTPKADEWWWSDDDAVDLLHNIVTEVRSIEEMERAKEAAELKEFNAEWNEGYA